MILAEKAGRGRWMPWLGVAAILAGLSTLVVPAAEEETRPGPDPLYRREDHTHRIDSEPEGERLPSGLTLRMGRHDFPSDVQEMDREATEAGRWTAGEVARRTGSLIYYRAGFYDGVHKALHLRPDAGIDFSEGLRWGSRDPGALSHGEMAGAAAAEERAREMAAREVEAQFMDLSREPAFEPVAAPPAHLPVVTGIVAPPLEDVLPGVRPEHVPGLHDRFHRAFDGWRFDPPGLYRASGYRDFVERDWESPERAFEFWVDGKRRSAFYRNLQRPLERKRFRDVFLAAYSARMTMLLEEDLASSYGLGRRDGWRYGVVAVAEWRYRQGYAEGFNQAAATAAQAAYRSLFPEAYRRHYEDQHRTWSAVARPGIVSFRIEDAGHDGIFQPGEEVEVRLEVANYGGAPGTWEGVIDSPILTEPVRISLDLPPRAVVMPSGPVTSAVRQDVARGERAEVEVRGGGIRDAYGILVSYPLQFTGRAGLARVDVIAGVATAEVEVANRSRRSLGGTVILEASRAAGGGTQQAEMADLMPGEVRRLEFPLDGIDPLEALSGSARLAYRVQGAEDLHDQMDYIFPALALDLDSRELERFLVSLAMDESPSGREIRLAHDLALERIAADWEVAAGGSGNPYKHDWKERDETTALGGLVRTYRDQRSRILNHEIFSELGSAIESMADDLPGVHPFLRKYVLRLARELG